MWLRNIWIHATDNDFDVEIDGKAERSNHCLAPDIQSQTSALQMEELGVTCQLTLMPIEQDYSEGGCSCDADKSRQMTSIYRDEHLRKQRCTSHTTINIRD